MKINLEDVILHCRKLGYGLASPVQTSRGLCNELHEMFRVDLSELVNFSTFPYFSGSDVYPVPSMNSDYTAEEYYGYIQDVCTG